MWWKVTAFALIGVLAACGGESDESLTAVCDDFQAIVDAGGQLPGDWADFEPVVDRAAEVDELAGAAGNITSDMADDADPDALVSSVEGFYRRCYDAGWEN